VESAHTISIRDMTSSTRDEHARFEVLFVTYQHPLLNYLYRLVGDSARAEELCQETFTRAYRARRSLEQVQNARAWLYRIATNAARDHLRRRRLLAWLPLFDEDPALSVEDPEADASENQAVRSALLKLGPDLRVPLVLYTCQELSTQEIAAILGVSRDAIKQRLVRARLRFKQVYEGEATSEAEK
jgi:RNA polymerase sigma-70 factor (ECF subfamily)